MKRIFCFCLVLLLLGGMAACGGGGEILVEEQETPTPAATDTPAPTPTLRPTPKPKSSPTAEPDPTPIPTPSKLSGRSGNLSWKVDMKTRTLTISGEGPMRDFKNSEDAPWEEFGHFSDYPVSHLVIEEGITHIGNRAFVHFDLKSLSLPNSLISIGKYAFYWVYIKSIPLPKNLAEIGESGFSGAISEFLVDPENEFFCAEDGVLFSKDMSQLIAYPTSKKGTKYTVPDSVKHIGDNAFYGSDCEFDCTLKAIYLPEGLVSIGDYAFACCERLTEFKLPGTVRSIGKGAFHIAYVREIELPEGMEEIGPGAFLDSFLKRIIIPASVEKIGKEAFWLSNVETVYFVGLPPVLEKDVFGGSYFNRNGEFVIRYPRELASAWAPKGQTTWKGFAIKPYDTLPAFTGKWKNAY